MCLFLFYLLVIFFFFKTILIFKDWKRDFKIFQVPSRTIWTLSHKWSNHINLKGRGNPLQSIEINTDWFITKIVHRNGECLLWIHTSVSWHALMCYKSNGKKMSLSKNMSLSQKLNLMTKVNVCIRQQSTHFTMVTVHHTDCIIIFMQDYTNSWFESPPPPPPPPFFLFSFFYTEVFQQNTWHLYSSSSLCCNKSGCLNHCRRNVSFESSCNFHHVQYSAG